MTAGKARERESSSITWAILLAETAGIALLLLSRQLEAPALFRSLLAWLLLAGIPGLGYARWLSARFSARQAAWWLGWGFGAMSTATLVAILTAPVGGPPWLACALAACVGLLLPIWPTPGALAIGEIPIRQWLPALAAAVILLFSGPDPSVKTDMLAHVAAVRASAEEERSFPLHEFYREAEGTGADPRFGALHAQYGVWSRLAGVEPVELWHAVHVVGGVYFAVAAACTASSATVTGVGFLLVLLSWLAAFGGRFYDPFRVSAFPLWTAFSAIWLALNLPFAEGGRWSRRHSVLLACIVVSLSGYHIFAFLLACYFLLVGSFPWTAGASARIRSTLLWSVALGLPILAIRFALSYGNENPIHQRPWLLMELGGGLLTVSPVYLLQWLFPMGFIGIAVSAIPGGRRGVWEKWALASSLLSLAVMTIPWLLMPAMKFLGFLPLRLIMAIPFPILLGTAAERLVAARMPGSVVRLLAWATTLILCLPLAGRTLIPLATRGSENPRLIESPLFQAAVSRLESEPFVEPVLLSDPYTMMAIRATSRAKVVAVPDGRSSPRDSEAIDRLRETWKALNGSDEETERVLAKRGVTHVLIHALHDDDMDGYEYPWERADWTRQRAKFAGRPDRFEALLLEENFALFRVVDGDSARTEGPAFECVEPIDPEATALPLHDGFAIVGATAQLRVTGETSRLRVRGQLVYTGGSAPPHRALVVRADWQNADQEPGAFSKLRRKLLEKRTGVARRLRWDASTGSPSCPTYLLSPGVAIPIDLDLPWRGSASPGDYAVQIQVVNPGGFTLLRLRDLFQDEDVYSGPAIAEVHWPGKTAGELP